MPTIQTRLKELTLRFDPEALLQVLADRDGQVWEIPNTESSVCYAFRLSEDINTLGDNPMQQVTDEQRLAEAKVEAIYRIIGMHNGEYAAVPMINVDPDISSRGTVWLPRMDEELIVMDIPDTSVTYDDLLESSYGESDSFAVPIAFGETIVDIELLIESYGNECVSNGSGNFAIFHLRDILTNTNYAFSVRTVATNEISNVLDAITADPRLLLVNFPDCIELVAIGATHVRTTWNSVMVPYTNLEAGEPSTGTDTKPNLVSLLVETPEWVDKECVSGTSHDDPEDSTPEAEGEFDTEWLSNVNAAANSK